MPILPTRGTITFVFDDGYERVHENVLPILKRYNLPAVFAIPLDAHQLESAQHRYVKIPQKVRPWQDWMHVEQDGHEVASHSETHPDLTTISPEQLERELRVSAQTLGASTFVYPGGGYNDQVLEAVKRHYTAARTVKRGFETIPPRDPHRLRTFNFSRNNFRLWKANLFALWAWLTNAWMIETYHMIDEDDTKMVHTVKTKPFEHHIRFVSRLPIRVRTVKDIVSV